jgi:hypothetical protein
VVHIKVLTTFGELPLIPWILGTRPAKEKSGLKTETTV